MADGPATPPSLGSRLKAARKALHWTLRQAERRSGVPNAHISQLETGTIRHPSTGVLVRLSGAYGISLTELITLAGRADFGEVDAEGRLASKEDHDMWTMAVWLPKGREGEAVGWMNAHGLEVYRIWQPEQIARMSK